MKKITKLKIGGITYKVIYCELDELMGITDFTTSTIKIDNNQNDSQKFATLIHEILHCLNNQLTEMEVEFLAQGINQVIKDNFK